MILLLSLLVAMFQGTPVPTGTIEGTVQHMGSNAGIGGITVRARHLVSGTDLQTTSDASGRFLLRGVPAGRVNIEPLGEGYLFSWRDDDGAVVPGADQHLLSVNGNPIPGRNLTFSANVPSGETLKLPPIRATAPAAIRGRIVDSEKNPIPNVILTFIAEIADDVGRGKLRYESTTAQTDQRGEFRRVLAPGTYFIKAMIERKGAANLSVYYPSTTDAQLAAPIVLSERAEVAANIEVSADAAADSSSISGRVLPVETTAQPSVRILLKPKASPTTNVLATRDDGTVYGWTDQKTGRFELRGVTSGSYDFFASSNIDGREYLTKIPMEVRGRDIDDLEIALKPGAAVKGRLTVEGSSDLQLLRSGFGTVKIELNRLDNLFRNYLSPTVDSAGSAFVFSDVPPGEYSLAASFVGDAQRTVNPDLYVLDIRASGRSVIETGFEVGLDPTDDLEVVIGTQGATIAGSVIGAREGQPFLVTIAPDISRRGTASLPRSVAVKPSGEFEIRGLRPGAYQILAVVRTSPLSASRFYEQAIRIVIEKGASLSGIKVPILTDR